MDDGQRGGKLADWVEQHYRLLYRYAFRLTGSTADAEDLTQQAFLIAQNKCDQLRNPAHVRSWLCSIVRNTYLKSLRNRDRVPLENVAEPTDPLPHEVEIDQDELQKALSELPEEFRTPLILFYFQEFSYRQIAEQMDVPIGTVMSRLARAKSHLRRRLLSPQPAAGEAADTY